MKSKSGPVKCITLRQPWAWLVVNGHKDIENRSWRTHHRGRLLIHASQKPESNLESLRKEILRRFRIRLPEHLECGGIVGQVTIVDCVTKSRSRWFLGEFGFVCEDAKRLRFVRMKGQLNIYNVSASIVRRAESRRNR